MATEAESLESQIMLSDQSPQSPIKHGSGYSYRNSHSKDHHMASLRNTKRSSVPLDIPGIISPKNDMLSSGSEDEDYEDENGEMVPPHLVVARRNSAKTRSHLRGRNLRQLRNSILRMTGFLES